MARSVYEVFLNRFGVGVGDYVEVVYDGGKRLRGVLMPKTIFSGEDILVLKLDNGYNIGIKMERIADMRRLDPPWSAVESVRRVVKRPGPLPRVRIIAVGGTILSRVDYRTGGVRSAVTPEDLFDIIPEVLDIADIETVVLMNKYSEHLTPADWGMIAEAVYKAYRDGVEGVVVLHGTDTLGYTSAALSYALRGIDIPVILVGSQRSSDRPSSDAAVNLLSALYAAGNMDVGGVFVAMHHTTSDDLVAIHLGTRVRKNHTSARYAFETIGAPPLALVKNLKEIRYTWLREELRFVRRGEGSVEYRPSFAERGVFLLKFFPGMDPRVVRMVLASGIDVLVMEGTGLGHVSQGVIEVLEEFIGGVKIFMTSQCIWGRTNLRVYDTGRDLLRIGVIPLEDMLSETAYVKASWVLGSFGKDFLETLMPTPIAHDILPREFPARRRCVDDWL